MSWDTVEYIEEATCACSKGKVIRSIYESSNDWNQHRQGTNEERILCKYCNEKYHIEHYIRYYYCPTWIGDGVVDGTYLVQNGLCIPKPIGEKRFDFSVEEKIVSMFTLNEIIKSKEDMILNKYSTRVKLETSKNIISLYNDKYKRRSLPKIIEMLENIEQKYNTFKWTYEKMKTYRENEQEKIKRNNEEINNVIKQSYKLEFKRIKHR